MDFDYRHRLTTQAAQSDAPAVSLPTPHGIMAVTGSELLSGNNEEQSASEPAQDGGWWERQPLGSCIGADLHEVSIDNGIHIPVNER